jgi:hypothetical protein
VKRNQVLDIASQHQMSYCCGWLWKGHGFKMYIPTKRIAISSVLKANGGTAPQNKPQAVLVISFAIHYS